MIPKLHYMVHYPSQILKYGPLIHSWTMRHEAKLYVIKRAASHGNFKNISFTVAKRTQHAFCYHLNSGDPLLDSSINVSRNSSCTSLSDEPADVRQFVENLGLSIETLTHPTWIKVNCLSVSQRR